MPQTVYLADDEKNIRELMAAFLTQEGFITKTFSTGDSLLNACEKAMPNVVILDIMMPGTDGLTVCTQLRKQNTNLPIIIVSAKDSPYDRVMGLTLGGDDYMVKPFLPLELVARIRGLLRRSQTVESESAAADLTFGPLCVSPSFRTVTLHGEALPLTPTEFDFLAYLIAHQERAVSREELLRALWQVDWQAETRASDDLVKRLRKKLRERHSEVQIETVWGYGFRLTLGDQRL
ncbi:MAG: response regulator transcription factor [Eubacteriales bacterium]|nr:response regulator transcription factor [Eubacteriales bacterium]